MTRGYPGNISVTIAGPYGQYPSNPNREGYYDIKVNSDSTASLIGGKYTDLTEPFTFAYTGPVPDEFGDYRGFEPTHFYSFKLNRVYFFYNDVSDTDSQSPMVSILHVADPLAVFVETFNYDGAPGYLNGPVQNFWDMLQVVELPESGADCFHSVYLHYNETGVSFIDYHAWTPDSFTLNAISSDEAGQNIYACNVKNTVDLHESDGFENSYEFATGYVLEKVHIATGEKWEVPIQNISSTLPEVAITTEKASKAPSAAGSMQTPTAVLSPSLTALAVLLIQLR